jgi:hypothetical protein
MLFDFQIFTTNSVEFVNISLKVLLYIGLYRNLAAIDF